MRTEKNDSYYFEIFLWYAVLGYAVCSKSDYFVQSQRANV